jgi:hypothetical protein
MHQLTFDFQASQQTLTRNQLQQFLNESSRFLVQLTLTHNRSTMVSIEWNDPWVSLRCHRYFLHAPHEVLRTLRRYINCRRKADWEVISEFACNIPADQRSPRRRNAMKAKGKTYDLSLMADEVNRTFFGGTVNYSIGWGKHGRPTRKKRRSIRYGSFCADSGQIRIHPALDSFDIPEEFVRYIIFHEMLHAVVPPKIINGRHYPHPPEFQKREKAYPDFSRMEKLAAKLLARLR